MSKLLKKPTGTVEIKMPSRYEEFNLKENPFPSVAAVNKDSNDPRVNGTIYEGEIRTKERNQIKERFLKVSQSNPNHSRLGYIIDASFIGRGNGKTAFLINLQQDVNREYCLDISEGVNKCFAVYVSPEPGGRTKTFASFVDNLFQAIIRSGIINTCLATLRLEAIRELYPDRNIQEENISEECFIKNLNSTSWLAANDYDVIKIQNSIFENSFLQDLPNEFPLFRGRNSLVTPVITQIEFETYYKEELRKGRERLDFVFSHLVRLFQSANFNGSYVLVDDFERIPDFQSARQKRDFALELRSSLFDGPYLSASYGFYNFLLVLHAGVQRLISDAWNESGIENRAPISPLVNATHVIPFEKLSRDHASLLLLKYLSQYRISPTGANDTKPFTDSAISRIGELSEYNASRILKMAYDLLEKLAEDDGSRCIDEAFIARNKEIEDEDYTKGTPKIEDVNAIDLRKKAQGKE